MQHGTIGFYSEKYLKGKVQRCEGGVFDMAESSLNVSPCKNAVLMFHVNSVHDRGNTNADGQPLFPSTGCS